MIYRTTVTLGFTLLLSSCSSVPASPVERPHSSAFAEPLSTSVGRLSAEQASQHDGLSGFALIKKSRVAFAARIGLTQLAEKSLDVQYYIWEGDTTGKLLALKVRRAAERGVKVRLLLDDNNLQGRDNAIAALDRHPNIEIRIFNPFANRERHLFDFATDFGRVNHRMHNKVMIIDGALAIVGGRNIGDHYFGVNASSNFRDLDIATTGPIVDDLSASFDDFWNGPSAFPMTSLVAEIPGKEERVAIAETMRKELEAEPYPYPLEQDAAITIEKLQEIFDNMVWSKGYVIADKPEGIAEASAGVIKQAAMKKTENLQKQLFMEAAYFVQDEGGVEVLQNLVKRGVKVRVLTNSLASNDVVAAHAGYEKNRKTLLQAGVEMYELRPDSSGLKQEWNTVGGKSKAALHTKALQFDGEAIFVGSYNLDPRSANINTEIGLYVESSELARQLEEYMQQGIASNNAYHVRLDEDGDLIWEASDAQGQLVSSDVEPATSWLKRVMADFIKLLPAESQL